MGSRLGAEGEGRSSLREVGSGQLVVGREEGLREEQCERSLGDQDKTVGGGCVCVPMIKRGSDGCGPALAPSRGVLADTDDTENLWKFPGQRATSWKA